MIPPSSMKEGGVLLHLVVSFASRASKYTMAGNALISSVRFDRIGAGILQPSRRALFSVDANYETAVSETCRRVWVIRGMPNR